MTQTKPGQKIKRKKITFSIDAAVAKEVILLGDFNSWTSKKHKMTVDHTARRC